MRNLIKIVIPIIATLGIVALIVLESKAIGLLITLFFTPILIIYALLVFRSKLKTAKTKLKPLFISVATLNTIVIVLHVVIKTMHYPFFGITKLLGAFLCVLTLVITVVYFIINRKQISSDFTYEIVIMLFPSIIFIWSIIPYSVPPQLYEEYVELISESNHNLEITNKSLVADSCQFDNLARIGELKDDIIKKSGGFERNRLGGFYDDFCGIYIDKEKDFINNLDIEPKLKAMILNVKINGDAVFLLTQIESALKLKKCHR
ncbi:MAG: hypothetical protein ACJA1C_000869 [Crocinitomicaceae bacterium]|jgi:hypothetical protein